jgi:hypothetical protein
MARDTPSRPHELLNLKIKDVEIVRSGPIPSAEIIANDKTGFRTLPLIDSIPSVPKKLGHQR